MINDITTFENEGYLWFREELDENDLSTFDQLSSLENSAGARIAGANYLTHIISKNSLLLKIAQSVLAKAFPVRMLAFNKSHINNWGVPWHQDRVIAVQNKHDVYGFSNWSVKSGIWHCEPPLSILQNMIFMRVHLDDCDTDNGAMELAVGSHQRGKIPADEAKRIANTHQHEQCRARRGDILIVKMLTLHRSMTAARPLPRRTYRIDFAAQELIPPLEWAFPSKNQNIHNDQPV